MSNAIANSFALLNEIRQELNTSKTNARINRSPSPKKLGLSNPASTTAPFRANNINTLVNIFSSLIKSFFREALLCIKPIKILANHMINLWIVF